MIVELGHFALVLALVPELVARPPTVPLHLAFTHDEETGCFGAPALAQSLGAGIPLNQDSSKSPEQIEKQKKIDEAYASYLADRRRSRPL